MRALRSEITLLVCALFAAAVAGAGDAPAPAALVGTWRLVSFENVVSGETVRPFGDRPVGLFVYTPDGYVTIQIANPANPVCLAPTKKFGPGSKDDLALPPCSEAQRQALLNGYVAYWGTYTVDAAAGVVIHHVKSDIGNGYIGTDQRRPFRLEGDRLVIGDGKTWTRVLERVH
jgi:Lipocalin-like domain